MSLWCRHAQYHLEGIAQSSGLRRSIYVEPVRTPFPQITAAPNQLRRTSSTFHRDSALCQQYNLVAYHLRLAVICTAHFVDLLHSFTASLTRSAIAVSNHPRFISYSAPTYMVMQKLGGRSPVSSRERPSLQEDWHMRRLTTVQQHMAPGDARLTMSSPCDIPA